MHDGKSRNCGTIRKDGNRRSTRRAPSRWMNSKRGPVSGVMSQGLGYNQANETKSWWSEGGGGPSASR